MKVREVIRLLQQDGWCHVRTRGSHRQFQHPEKAGTVTVAGKSIDPINRSFFMEAKVPADKDLRPNQIALIRIQDYSIQNTITVPVNTVQSDEKGKFVMTAAKENGGD